MTVTEPYDVIVLGGGTAGVVAAIQAGRAGARTLLVEKTGMLGGTNYCEAVFYYGDDYCDPCDLMGGPYDSDCSTVCGADDKCGDYFDEITGVWTCWHAGYGRDPDCSY